MKNSKETMFSPSQQTRLVDTALTLFFPSPTQGTCGSCWAYVAAGSVEASAARSAALDAYQGFKSTSSSYSGRTTNNNHNNNKVDINKASPASAALHNDKALTNARRVEYDAMQMLNLSIQELIDCDTRADEGCTGGNPILAFYFIHRYGLVSWEQYPYGMCIDTHKMQALLWLLLLLLLSTWFFCSLT
jgi:Papain family cysteine protease